MTSTSKFYSIAAELSLLSYLWAPFKLLTSEEFMYISAAKRQHKEAKISVFSTLKNLFKAALHSAGSASSKVEMSEEAMYAAAANSQYGAKFSAFSVLKSAKEASRTLATTLLLTAIGVYIGKLGKSGRQPAVAAKPVVVEEQKAAPLVFTKPVQPVQPTTTSVADKKAQHIANKLEYRRKMRLGN